MATPLHVLIVASQAAAARSMAEELQRAGWDVDWQWAEPSRDGPDFSAAAPDMILCEHHLPLCDAFRELQFWDERQPDVPLLIVSALQEDDVALEAMRRGAVDCLPWETLAAELGPAVQRILARRQFRHERQRHEESQLSAAVLFRNVVEHSLVGLQILQDGKYAFANQKVGELFGYTVNELLALPSWTAVVAPDDRERVLDQVRRRVTGELPSAHYIFQGLRKDGRVIDVEIRSDRTELDGRPAVIGTLIDVTERRQAEAILRESEERFRSAFEHTNVAMVLTDLDNRFIRANVAFARLFGYEPDEILTLTMRDVTHPEHLAESLQNRQRLLAGEQDYFQMEKRYLRKDGRELWGLTNVSIFRSVDGRPQWYVGQVQDITERKAATHALRAAEGRFRSLVEQSIVGFYMIQGDRFTYVNPRLAEIVGYPPQQLLSRPVLDFVVSEDRLIVAENIRRRLQGEISTLRYSLRMRHHDGHTVSVEVHGTTTDHDGQPAIIGVLLDVTEQRRAEEERNRFFSISPDLFCIASFEGRFKRLNPAWATTLGWTTDELLPRPLFDFVHPDDREAAQIDWSQLIGGAPAVASEIRYRCRDGSYKWCRWNAVADSDQQLIYATATDMTEARRLEQQLHQAQKMEAIGRLAGGVAHDFNNLLTVINGYGEFLADELPADSPLRNCVEEIIRAGQRAATLTRQLLAFSRKQVLMPVRLDVNGLLREMDKMLGRLIGEEIEFQFVLDEELWPIRADGSQIEQVVMNLTVNARDAMSQGGQLTIETKNVEVDETYAAMHHGARPGQYALMAVTDTGCGMDKATQAQIFEPFFSTKGERGTGLGLSTVDGIIRQSGGHIEVYSELGVGTTFKVYLPRDRTIGPSAPTAAETKSAGLGTETILLVEDEDAVRTLAKMILERNGYRVLAARHGEEALAVCQRAETIHLLVTDVVMPHMPGRNVARRVQELRPHVKVLYLSGYTDDTVVRHGVLEAHMHFLQKPFTSRNLTQKVRMVLDS